MARLRSKRSPSSNNRASADQTFSGFWSQHIADTAKRNSDGKPKRIALERNLTQLFAERQRLQRRIFHILRGELEGGTELMDLFSGAAVISTSLVACGKIDRLELVDNGKSPNELQSARLLATQNGTRGKVQLLEATISGSMTPGQLPETQNVVLAETGLVLPSENRITGLHNGVTDPNMFRSSHINNPGLTLGDVLRVLSGTQQRILHVFDTPSPKSPLNDINIARDFVQSFVTKLPEWTIKSWAPVEGTDMFHGVLDKT